MGAAAWLLGLTLVAGCSTTEAAGSGNERSLSVRVATASEGAPTTTLRMEGVTRAVQRASLSLQSGGRLSSRSVRVGDRVGRGQVLARLDASGWRNGRDAASSRLLAATERIDQLERDRARLEALAGRGSAAGAELESVRSILAAAESDVSALRVQVREADRQVRESVLTAPFSGEVVAVHGQAGEVVAAGRPLIELAGSGVEVAVAVPESAWAKLSMNTEAGVRLPAFQETVAARVVDLAGASSQSGLFTVVVGFEHPRAVAGLTAEVQLALPNAASVVVPVRSIVDPTGESASVFRVTDDRAVRVPVELSGIRNEQVEVTGVSHGDAIVVSGQSRLIDGSKVVVLP